MPLTRLDKEEENQKSRSADYGGWYTKFHHGQFKTWEIVVTVCIIVITCCICCYFANANEVTDG